MNLVYMSEKQPRGHMGKVEQVKKFPRSLPEECTPVVGIHFKTFFNKYSKLGKGETLSRIYEFFFRLFENWYGVRLYIELPDTLKDIHPDIWDLGHMISALKKEDILSHVEMLPNRHDEPMLYRYHSVLPNLPGPFHSLNGVGHSFFSEKEALLTSIGEAVERNCYRHFFPDDSITIKSTYRELKDNAINPLRITGISDEIRKKSSDIRLRPIIEDTNLTWVQGFSLVYGYSTWIPLQLVTVNPIIQQGFVSGKETIIRQSVSTGAAVGQGKSDALYRGICEVIERDAFMITYLNCIAPPKIKLSDLTDERLSFIKRQFEKHNLEAFVLRLPTDFPVHSIMVYLRDKKKQSPYFSLGFKTDLDLDTACYGAMKEALNARIANRFTLERVDSLDSDPMQRKEYEQSELYTRVHQWLTNPDWVSQIEFLIGGEEVEVSSLPQFSAATGSFEDKLSFLTSFLEKENIEAVYVENTTKNLKKACHIGSFSLRSYFVVIPSLQSMHLSEDFACNSGVRLKSVPEKLGYTVDADFINPLPHPVV